MKMTSYPKDEDMELPPPPMAETLTGGALAALWGLVGRLMYRARSASMGRRKFFDLAMIYELPIAIGTGIIGQGIADYYGLQGWTATACIVTAGYLGPGFVEAVVWRVVDKYAPKGDK